MPAPMDMRAWAALGLLVSACSSGSAPAPSTTGGSSSPSPRPPPPSETFAPPPPGLAAPEVTRVMKMAGALHVVWRNVATCDAIEIERRGQKDSGVVVDDYAVVFTEPGNQDNQMDNAATADLTYTYRLRCETAGAYSDYSNEMSENPTR